MPATPSLTHSPYPFPLPPPTFLPPHPSPSPPPAPSPPSSPPWQPSAGPQQQPGACCPCPAPACPPPPHPPLPAPSLAGGELPPGSRGRQPSASGDSSVRVWSTCAVGGRGGIQVTAMGRGGGWSWTVGRRGFGGREGRRRDMPFVRSVYCSPFISDLHSELGLIFLFVFLCKI